MGQNSIWNHQEKFINLMESRRFVFGKKHKDLDVYLVPIELLSYNKNNGRIFLGVNEKEKEGVDLDSLSLDDFNEEIEQLIWDYDTQKNILTKNSIHEVGQLEVALLSNDGIIIDGNRRFTCIRKLNKEFRTEEKYKFLKACIIDPDEEITKKDIKKYELNVQFGKETKADYHLTDKVMSIFREVEEQVLSIDEIAEQMNVSPAKVRNFVITAETIIDFLDYFKISEKYFIIDRFNYVGPLEAIAKYLNKGAVRQSLSSVELQARKIIAFEILVAAKLQYPTQDIRDSLLRDIFSKNPDICTTFLNEYEEDISSDYFNFINENLSEGDFYSFKETLKNSNIVSSVNKVFQKYRDLSNIKNTLDGQIDLAEKALEAVRNIDIAMFDNIDNPEAEVVFNKIKDTLRKTKNEIDGIVNEE